MTANVKKRAVVVCNRRKCKSGEFQMEESGEKMNYRNRRPIHLPWRRNIKERAAPGVHTYIPKVIGRGKTQGGEMHAILTDSHLDNRIEVCIMMNAIVPKLEYAREVWGGNASS